MQAMFATAMQNMASAYFKGKQPKKDKVPTEEFNNLNLEKDVSLSDSDSSSSEEDWYTHGTHRNNICLGLGQHLYHFHGPVTEEAKVQT